MAPPQRSALGALFLFLAAAFAGVTYAAVRAARNHPGVWAIVAAAAVLAIWMGTLAFRALGRR